MPEPNEDAGDEINISWGSPDAPEKVAERVRNDFEYWSRVIKELGITAG